MDWRPAPSAGRFQSRFQAQVAEMMEGEQKVLLVKPETFMNLSGRAVRQVIDFYQVELADLLVVARRHQPAAGQVAHPRQGVARRAQRPARHPEPPGDARLPRLRIGVGAGEEDLVDHVLGRFRPSERPVIDDAISLAIQAVVALGRPGRSTSV